MVFQTVDRITTGQHMVQSPLPPYWIITPLAPLEVVQHHHFGLLLHQSGLLLLLIPVVCHTIQHLHIFPLKLHVPKSLNSHPVHPEYL